MAEFDVLYRNPDTNVVFGFDLPLPPGVLTQIAAGRLVRSGTETPALPDPLADGDGSAGPDDDLEDEPGLHPCLDCGDTAVKDAAGEYTDHCKAHTPKPVPAPRKGK
jgi:hypothetical protein